MSLLLETLRKMSFKDPLSPVNSVKTLRKISVFPSTFAENFLFQSLEYDQAGAPL